jgi:hypothetical protein
MYQKTQLLPQVAMEKNLHQRICRFIGFILVKTSYTIVEGTEMYFSQIKKDIQDKIKTHVDLDKNIVINSIFTR